MGSQRIIPPRDEKKVGVFIIPALFFLSIFFEWLTFPNDVLSQGIPFFAFVYCALFIFALRHLSPRIAIFWGLAYGVLECVSVLFWLLTYHPGALLITAVFTSIFYALSFLILIPIIKNKKFHFLIPLWIVGLQYVKSLGFLGNPYASLGYSQAFFEPLRNLSTIGGIWLIALWVAYVSYFLQGFFKIEGKKISFIKRRFSIQKIVLFSSLFISPLIFALALQNVDKPVSYKKILFVQHNIDPWLGEDGNHEKAYEESKRRLLYLTEQGLTEHTDAQLIVWSETAFIPSIELHRNSKQSTEKKAMANEILDAFKRWKIPVLMGNDHGVLDQSGKRLDYNASLLYEGGNLKSLYAKRHLVPFSEFFPWAETFPAIRDYLASLRSSFWEPGLDATQFHLDGFTFATPICFEDSFGNDILSLQNKETEGFIVLANDTWSGSIAAMMQHHAMAVFRANETGLPMLRVTNGGFSSLIDPQGRTLFEAPISKQGAFLVDFPIYAPHETPYEIIGDSIAILCLIIFGGFLIFVFIRNFFKRGDQ